MTDTPGCALDGCSSPAKRGRSFCSTHTAPAERERYLLARHKAANPDRRPPEWHDFGWLLDGQDGPVPVLSGLSPRPDGSHYLTLLHRPEALSFEPGVEPPVRYDKDAWLRLRHPDMAPEDREQLVASDRVIHDKET